MPRPTQSMANTEPRTQTQTLTQAPLIAMTISQITNMATQMDAYFGSKMTNHEEGAIARIIYETLNINLPETPMDQDPPIDAINVNVSTNDATLTNDANVTTDVMIDADATADVSDVNSKNDAAITVSHDEDTTLLPYGSESPSNSQPGSPTQANKSPKLVAICLGRHDAPAQKGVAAERPESPTTGQSPSVSVMSPGSIMGRSVNRTLLRSQLIDKKNPERQEKKEKHIDQGHKRRNSLQ